MNKIAVLLSGGVNASSNYSRYIADLREMYLTLITKYNYAKSDVYVLYADGVAQDLDGDGQSEIYADCTYASVKTLFQAALPARLTTQDLLFIFSTNHGGLTNVATKQAKLWLWGGSVEDVEFASWVNGLKFANLIVCMEQCYSGGFVDDLVGPNRVVATACRHDQVSWSCDSEGNYDEFCYYWTAAMRGATPAGQAVAADCDGDGHVSVKDAFQYAATNDSASEEPQYYEQPTGLGKRLTLNGLVEVALCGQAALRPITACQTFAARPVQSCATFVLRPSGIKCGSPDIRPFKPCASYASGPIRACGWQTMSPVIPPICTTYGPRPLVRREPVIQPDPTEIVAPPTPVYGGGYGPYGMPPFYGPGNWYGWPPLPWAYDPYALAAMYGYYPPGAGEPGLEEQDPETDTADPGNYNPWYE